jgi:hypothetical protein
MGGLRPLYGEEAFVNDRSIALAGGMNGQGGTVGRNFLFLVWLLAGAVPFLPFALDTSPWDAVRMHVPGNQGNWWHIFVGAPFFLAYPAIWLRLLSLYTKEPLAIGARRVLWGANAFSIGTTVAVETPFLLHLAGTSAWQRLAILSLGLGILLCSGTVLFLRRRQISIMDACLAGLSTAYLANAALCLVVYNGAPGSPWSRLGWIVSMVVFWPMLIELIWLLAGGFQSKRKDGLRECA